MTERPVIIQYNLANFPPYNCCTAAYHDDSCGGQCRHEATIIDAMRRKMVSDYSPENAVPSERRTDYLSEAIINSAIDMEAALGAVQAIVYMRRHSVPMDVALRVVLKQAERRVTSVWDVPATSDRRASCSR